VFSISCALSAAVQHTALPRRIFFQTAMGAVSIAPFSSGVGKAHAAELALPVTGGKMVKCTEQVMAPKTHGTTEKPVQEDLRYGVDRKTADRICSYNRHYAEYSGYWKTTNFLKEVSRNEPTIYYDSVTGKPLFVAPIGRSFEDFIRESDVHGWPSFRDQEVVWENMRVLDTSGEAVSVDGTHLGHNLPDRNGNRYCINLVSIAGRPNVPSKEEI